MEKQSSGGKAEDQTLREQMTKKNKSELVVNLEVGQFRKGLTKSLRQKMVDYIQSELVVNIKFGDIRKYSSDELKKLKKIGIQKQKLLNKIQFMIGSRMIKEDDFLGLVSEMMDFFIDEFFEYYKFYKLKKGEEFHFIEIIVKKKKDGDTGSGKKKVKTGKKKYPVKTFMIDDPNSNDPAGKKKVNYREAKFKKLTSKITKRVVPNKITIDEIIMKITELKTIIFKLKNIHGSRIMSTKYLLAMKDVNPRRKVS